MAGSRTIEGENDEARGCAPRVAHMSRSCQRLTDRLARLRERGLKPERGAGGAAAAERSAAALTKN